MNELDLPLIPSRVLLTLSGGVGKNSVRFEEVILSKISLTKLFVIVSWVSVAFVGRRTSKSAIVLPCENLIMSISAAVERRNARRSANFNLETKLMVSDKEKSLKVTLKESVNLNRILKILGRALQTPFRFLLKPCLHLHTAFHAGLFCRQNSLLPQKMSLQAKKNFKNKKYNIHFFTEKQLIFFVNDT